MAGDQRRADSRHEKRIFESSEPRIPQFDDFERALLVLLIAHPLGISSRTLDLLFVVTSHPRPAFENISDIRWTEAGNLRGADRTARA